MNKNRNTISFVAYFLVFFIFTLNIYSTELITPIPTKVIFNKQKAFLGKKLFLDNGFKIVYDKDEDELIADGFYFTFSYPGFTGAELLGELIYYGISAISLAITGSERIEGVRACVSLVKREQFPVLEERLQWFHKNHSS